MLRRRRHAMEGKKKAVKHKGLTTNPFPRSVRVEDDRRGGSAVEQASSTPNGVRRWWKDSGRGEADLGVWEGGGGAREGTHSRNRVRMAGEGRSRGEGDVEASGLASLGSGRNEEEERSDQRVPHPSR